MYCAEKILNEAAYSDERSDDYEEDELPGQLVDDLIEPQANTQEPSGFAKLSLEELEQLLEDAINDEEYAKAAKIRDEIKRRSA